MGNLTGLTDGNGNETAYATDLWGRVETVTLADGTMEHYSYDHAGNVCAATDGNGNTVRYVYNRANQLAERHDAAGSIEKFTYDILGRLQGHCDRDEPPGALCLQHARKSDGDQQRQGTYGGLQL